ncbi:MFS transporter [Bdellovibrio sp.]|uniref:MFS transporter n=1 Tax=Bdellovibrio sp. TaxID=28201 RepID=UPI0039E66AE4
MNGPPEDVPKSMASNNTWDVIAATCAGTLIQWYDFYIFGSLATIIALHFFPPGNEVTALLGAFATFAAGFISRPIGAMIFGRLGDIAGRKYAFTSSLLIMGASTTLMGLLPTYQQVGVLAPLALSLLRLLQGLAMGGEYGGAVVYVAEFSPDGKRGFYTSFVQGTATMGLLVSLGIVLVTRLLLGEDSFKAWGWRVPFLLSVVLVAFGYFARRKMLESPVFEKIKAAGKTSASPLRDVLFNADNRKRVLLALFGVVAGQAVIWYTGHFYALYYLQTILKVDFVVASFVMAVALILATPLFVLFGALSDKYGRCNIMATGMILGAFSYYPIYLAMDHYATLSPQLLTSTTHRPFYFFMILLVFIQIFFVTMVYGPLAAFLVELFPPSIRYTALSLPYHVGNAIFGGLVPIIGAVLTTSTGNHLAGIAYPIAVALISALIGVLFVSEKNVKDKSHI